jgi:hypothetical protein
MSATTLDLNPKSCFSRDRGEGLKGEELRVLIILYIVKHNTLEFFSFADRDLNILVRIPCLVARTLLSERKPIEMPVGDSDTVIRVDYEVLEPIVKAVADITCTEAGQFKPV